MFVTKVSINFEIGPLIIMAIMGLKSPVKDNCTSLLWLSILVMISTPLASNLREFTVERNIEANFRRFKTQQITRLAIVKEDQIFWSTAIISYINTEIEKNHFRI